MDFRLDVRPEIQLEEREQVESPDDVGVVTDELDRNVCGGDIICHCFILYCYSSDSFVSPFHWFVISPNIKVKEGGFFMLY